MDNLYNDETGLPLDDGYLEGSLPPFLHESLKQMKKTWSKIDSGEKCWHWDDDYCTLQSDINCAEVEQIITPEQAWYLRKKYLRIEKPEKII